MYTHRGAYLNALGNVIETGLTAESVYLWTRADVPLQRLVLPLGGGRRGRHPGLPAQGRACPGLGPLSRPTGSPTTTARPPSTLDCQPPGRASARPPGDRHASAGRRPRRRSSPGCAAQPPADPRLRSDRDLRPDHRLRLAPRVGGACRQTSRPACSPARAGPHRGRPGAGGRRGDGRRAARRPDAWARS